MKKLLLTAFLLVSLFVAGCGGEKYGAGVDPDAPKVQVKDVFPGEGAGEGAGLQQWK